MDGPSLLSRGRSTRVKHGGALLVPYRRYAQACVAGGNQTFPAVTIGQNAGTVVAEVVDAHAPHKM